MQVVAAWSVIDLNMEAIAVNLMKADFLAVHAMLSALTGSEARRAAILATVKLRLKDDDLALFEAVEAAVRPSRRRRNEFAHHIWTAREDLPDAACLTDPKHLGLVGASLKHALATATPEDGISMPNDSYSEISKNTFVYRLKDLQDEADLASRCGEWVKLLHRVLTAPGRSELSRNKIAEARRMLLSQPEVQQALQRLYPQSSP